jgi:medium-chain acyl-[acyl-carrier-protein] hydrolase
MKIPESMYIAYGLKIDDSMPLEFEDMKGPSRNDYTKIFDVRYTDIDTNRHVNNVKYIDWAIETLPLDIVQNHTLKGLMVTYKKETTYGATIKSCTEANLTEGKALCRHNILDAEGKELCTLETLWVME